MPGLALTCGLVILAALLAGSGVLLGVGIVGLLLSADGL